MAQIESKVHDFLKKIAKERNFQDLKVTPITTGGANYSSLLYTATFSSKGKDDLHLFVKAAVMSDTMRGQVPHKVFDIEQFVYTDLKNSYRHMEEKHRVPEEHRLYIPEYYGANTTPMGEMLALENLVAKGFTTHHRLESMNWQYASAAATELAKLLALSVAFQKEYPDLFKHFSDDYLRSWLNESTLKMVWGPGISRALSALKEENKDKFKKYFDAADYSMIKRQFTPSKIKVLAHGDYRVSNLMHRTREILLHAMTDVEDRMRDLLHKIAREQEYEDYDLQITPISTEGANYSSTLYVAKVTSKIKDTLDLFIKISQIGAKIREDFKITIFETESFIYRDMKKTYMEIEEKHKVPEKHCIYIAKYYGAVLIPPDEMLVLENLAIRGFVIHDRFKSIDWEYASTAVNELVKLHSLSMAFQREYPKKFTHFSDNYQCVWLNDWTVNSLWLPGFEKAINVAPEEHKEKLKKFFDQYDIEKISREYDPLKCKVLTHGDYRPSNLMHRTRDDGSLEIIVVDHQTIQIGCPVTDLMYLIFTGTDKPFRDQYFDKLIDHYYTQLSEAMKRLDIDPETTYSRADFDFEMKEKLPLGLSIAAFTLPIVTVETEDAPDLNDDLDLSSFAVRKTGSLFPDRINGVVDDYVKWGILKD
ncbi:Ecdysteroid 22-kinase [Operophtera brumata]|uniref:Ecdysteroid 22-kinase n=2 Tax=Operophtera brumata TaxID=104452 RepID=A0A0L7KX70_OPEBR|nr:Ecdysteroid 22-kinase [Operophtera brumata]